MPFAGILGFTFAAGMVGALGWMEDGDSGLLVGEIRATGTVGLERLTVKLQRSFKICHLIRMKYITNPTYQLRNSHFRS